LNNRARAIAILNYEPYDRIPLVHFGYWYETLDRWADEGHLSEAEARAWRDGNPTDYGVSSRLGFDLNWNSLFYWRTGIHPPIERRVLETLPDGSHKVLNEYGAIVLERPGATSIPMEFDHILKGRAEWEEFFLPRLQFSEDRILQALVHVGGETLPFGRGGLDALKSRERDTPLGIYCGSLYGDIRNWLGLVNSAYLLRDDEALLDEIIDTVGELCYRGVKAVLDIYDEFDFGHFWEDICFKSGPLIHPRVFEEKVGPQYRRITDLLHDHGIDLVSLDCDGKIDALVPIWLANGVNVMFPIEVGTWHASIRPWREQYGRELRGVGGMDKKVFARDREAVDTEIERLRPLVELGGYIPCPDHRIPPDSEWDNVRYYCDRMREVFW
jgi:uroporphyrinogen decarboxylase